jgi:hypothetical protein
VGKTYSIAYWSLRTSEEDTRSRWTRKKPKDLSVCDPLSHSEECGCGGGGGVYDTLVESDTVESSCRLSRRRHRSMSHSSLSLSESHMNSGPLVSDTPETKGPEFM